MAKEVIKLKESELRKMVSDVIRESLDEGLLNKSKSAVGTFFGKGNGNFFDRLKGAKKNWDSQGELDDINGLRAQLTKLLDDRKITPETTVGQLVGGKYNNNKFGTMSGIAANRQAQIKRRGGRSYEEE